jgi:flagellar biosynthetic protein FliO
VAVNAWPTVSWFARLRERWRQLSSWHRSLVGALAVLVACLVALRSVADHPGEESGLLTALDLGAKLLLVLVLIWTCALLLRAMQARATVSGRRRSVEVLEVTPLAQNRTLYLVQVGDQTLLLGATPTQITTLTRLDLSPAFAAALERAREERP